MTEPGFYLECEVHGLLKFRQEPEPVWVCAGFDGEAAGWCTARVPDSARGRLVAGKTYWPGVLVRNAAGDVAGRQPEMSAAAARARQLVNRILQRPPIA